MHRGTMSVLAVSVLVRGFIMSSIHYYGSTASFSLLQTSFTSLPSALNFSLYLFYLLQWFLALAAIGL